MFTLVPNYDYESQSKECKNALCEQDFKEVCNLINIKKRYVSQKLNKKGDLS